jgi:hypothetical protein
MQLYIWAPVAIFWVSFVIRILRRGREAAYLASPLMLSLLLMITVGFTLVEYAVVILPTVLTFWEILGDK